MSSAPSLQPLTCALPTSIVGRQAELGQLYEWFEKALGGRRQVVFISGAAGIGKTTLVDLFVERVAAQTACWLARGQCVEHHGAGEAYLLVLEAASVVGVDFSAAAVAAGLGIDVETVEEHC